MPVIDELNHHYWLGAREHRLVILRCRACQEYVHPPRTRCAACRSLELEPTEVSGRGTVYSWSVMHSPGNPGFEDKLPFVVLVVELDEQARLITIGNLVDGDPADLRIGLAVEVVYEDVDELVTLPQWRIA
jgi:uncharacterized OB-fold protein